MATFFSRHIVPIGKRVLVHRTSISSNINLSINTAKTNTPNSHASWSRLPISQPISLTSAF